ncbi:MAG: DNA alkylation repair protein, partial [Candidatus Paceibacteria bacterium]
MEQKIINDIKRYRNEDKGLILGRFFKTGKGQYGEGDIFWGVDVPTSRKIAERYINTPRKEVLKLLQNKVHEVRLVGLLILVAQYRKAEPKEKADIVKFYLDNTKYVNNWDLV